MDQTQSSNIHVCPVCNGDKTFLKNKRLDLYWCKFCNHTFTFSKEDSNLYSPEYFQEEHKNWFTNPNYVLFDRIYSKLTTLTPRPFRLIDVGCGDGAFLKFLRGKDDTSYLCGVDLVANSYPGINFIQEDINSLVLKEKFDVVCNFMVIEHLKDPCSFIEKSSCILKNGGIMVVNTINNDSLIYLIARMLNRVGIRVAHDRLYSRHHLNHFTNKSLKRLLERNGYQVLANWNHNYPLAAVDVPKSKWGLSHIYKSAVGVSFLLSNLFGGGVEQTLICKKNKDDDQNNPPTPQ